MSEQEDMQEKVEISLVVSIVIEKSSTGYSSYAPAIPGCIAAGETLEETRRLMQEALQEHMQMTIDDEEAWDAVFSDPRSREV